MCAQKAKEKPGSFFVAGIGASAGGLEAINQFLGNVPENPGMAFVVVQHLSPDHKSLMPELLARHTRLKVIEAAHQMPLEKDCVYLLPSKKTLTVREGKLLLHEKEKATMPNNTIDVFFESLAEEYGNEAIGVILSGTGTDGTQGVKAISKKGGIVIVQDPATSAFNGMPNSAIAAGVSNLILHPQSMASELIDYINDPQSVRSLRLSTEDDELVLREIILLIRKATGQDFSYYKQPTLIRRLFKRMAELSISDVQKYLERLQEDVSEVKLLAQEFLINVTHFFRDPAAFEIIKAQVIPAIMQGKLPGDTVKVWAAACSSGEEAYSLAILFHEYLESSSKENITVKIFATDIDKQALDTGSKGIYPRSILQHVSGQRIARCFDAEGDHYRVKPGIRKMVVFSHHDILKDPPFGRLDLVCCRNMLIYINSASQKDILRKLHFSLNLNGYLFMGPSEHADAIRQTLEEVDKKWRIYTCVSKARVYDQSHYLQPIDKHPLLRARGETKVKNPLNHLGDIFKETLLGDPGYAGLFIDLNFEIKQAVGNYKNYLSFPNDSFNFHLLKLVHPDLAVVLSATVRKAVQENIPVNVKSVKLRAEKDASVSIYVKPFLHHNEYEQQFLFVVLRSEEKQASPPVELLPYAGEADNRRIAELEQELKETRENLQALLEEMEAANEELQSTNEEMVSANEELQSSNEELQSLNEELHTVSAEHQLKIKELMELNDDLNNYFRNSEIGQILVDKNFFIKKFSPSATRLVNLIPSDVHRPLADITLRFRGIDLIDEISKVMRTARPVEKELIIEESVFIMRIMPYERYDKRIDGAVVNFIDVTQLRRLDSLLDAIFKTVPSAIVAAKAVRNERKEITGFKFISVNPAGEITFGRAKEEIVGKTLKDITPSSHKEMLEIFKEVAETGRPRNYDFFNSHLNNWSNVVVVKFMDGVISVSTDITEKKKAADLVEKNYDELRKSLKLNKKKS